MPTRTRLKRRSCDASPRQSPRTKIISQSSSSTGSPTTIGASFVAPTQRVREQSQRLKSSPPKLQQSRKSRSVSNKKPSNSSISSCQTVSQLVRIPSPSPPKKAVSGQKSPKWESQNNGSAMSSPKTKSVKSSKLTMTIPEAGAYFYGLSRGASYRAAKNGAFSLIKISPKLYRVRVQEIGRAHV